MTHWKKIMDPEHLGSYDLPHDKDTIVTIKEVVQKEVIAGQGKAAQKRPVFIFEEKGIKPLICNPTNAKTIQRIYKTPEIEDWVGKKIQLYVTTEKAFGEMIDVVRIRPSEPRIAKAIMSPEGFAKALEAVKKREATIEGITARYDLTPEQLKGLQDA
jgi:hypothetical protein